MRHPTNTHPADTVTITLTKNPYGWRASMTHNGVMWDDLHGPLIHPFMQQLATDITRLVDHP